MTHPNEMVSCLMFAVAIFSGITVFQNTCTRIGAAFKGIHVNTAWQEFSYDAAFGTSVAMLIVFWFN